MLSFNKLQEVKADKKLEDIEVKVQTGKMDIITAAEKMEKITPATSVNGENGKIQYRIIKKIIIKDISKLPRKYLIPDSFLIKKDVLSGVKIPGVEIKKEKIIATY